jgi:hypothetical protein
VISLRYDLLIELVGVLSCLWIHLRSIVRRAASQSREKATSNQHPHVLGEAGEEGADAIMADQQHAGLELPVIGNHSHQDSIADEHGPPSTDLVREIGRREERADRANGVDTLRHSAGRLLVVTEMDLGSALPTKTILVDVLAAWRPKKC